MMPFDQIKRGTSPPAAEDEPWTICRPTTDTDESFDEAVAPLVLATLPRTATTGSRTRHRKPSVTVAVPRGWSRKRVLRICATIAYLDEQGSIPPAYAAVADDARLLCEKGGVRWDRIPTRTQDE